MNEKLFRTQFNHMDASEKQKLMEALTVPIYHGFLPPRSREKRIDLTPRLYAQRGERIHLTFLPLRQTAGMTRSGRTGTATAPSSPLAGRIVSGC